jgi:mannose-6-phosphate isomerase-like protein (cupin superfamily)
MRQRFACLRRCLGPAERGKTNEKAGRLSGCLTALWAVLFAASLAAQTPAPQPPAQPKPAPTTQKPRPPAAGAAATVTLDLTVTDNTGRTIEGANVTAMGPTERSGVTDGNGNLRLQGMRPGTYRVRFDADGYVSFEREVVTRAGVRMYDVGARLNEMPMPEPPPPPPAPEPKPAPMTLPPPGSPKTMTLLDWLDQNFITNREPQKESIVGCSGLEQALVWQIRDPWNARQHESADGMFYVIGGEGTLRLGEREAPVAAGGFAVVPRGTTYSFTRRGRNPLIVLAVLAGAPCAGQ